MEPMTMADPAWEAMLRDKYGIAQAIAEGDNVLDLIEDLEGMGFVGPSFFTEEETSH